MKTSTSFSSQRALVSSLSIALLALSMGCSPQPTDTPAQPVASATMGSELDDTVVTTSVKAALLAEESIKSMDIKIETNKGVVQLSGFVNDNKQIDRAVAVAQAVAGVKSVQSRMVLKDGASTVGSNLDDTVITSRVKAALLADKDTKSTDIGVETRKGEVMLSGFVATNSQIALAQKLAAKQEGVKAVRNELSVKK